MSPRRKSGLSKDDLEALKHLDAVLTAVRKVTALGMDLRAAVGVVAPIIGADFRRAHPVGGMNISQLARGCAHGQLPDGADCPVCHMQGVGGESPLQRAAREALRRRWTAPTILDTPERREYEAAKKAGKEVPPDLANISEAQRERMAEQKALVQQMRRAKGLPVAGEVEPVTEDQVVRTEELPTSESGSVGGEEDPEVH